MSYVFHKFFFYCLCSKILFLPDIQNNQREFHAVKASFLLEKKGKGLMVIKDKFYLKAVNMLLEKTIR